jgi:hypothetical protein
MPAGQGAAMCRPGKKGPGAPRRGPATAFREAIASCVVRPRGEAGAPGRAAPGGSDAPESAKAPSVAPDCLRVGQLGFLPPGRQLSSYPVGRRVSPARALLPLTRSDGAHLPRSELAVASSRNRRLDRGPDHTAASASSRSRRLDRGPRHTPAAPGGRSARASRTTRWRQPGTNCPRRHGLPGGHSAGRRRGAWRGPRELPSGGRR